MTPWLEHREIGVNSNKRIFVPAMRFHQIILSVLVLLAVTTATTGLPVTIHYCGGIAMGPETSVDDCCEDDCQEESCCSTEVSVVSADNTATVTVEKVDVPFQPVYRIPASLVINVTPAQARTTYCPGYCWPAATGGSQPTVLRI